MTITIKNGVPARFALRDAGTERTLRDPRLQAIADEAAVTGALGMAEGEGEGGAGEGGSGSGEGGQGGATPPANGPAGTGTGGGQGGEDTAKLQKALESERVARKEAEKKAKEAATERDAKAAEGATERDKLLKTIAQALNLDKSDTPPDPAQLQQTVAERETRIGSLEQENAGLIRLIAAWKVSWAEGANAEALTDSVSFREDLAKLDHTADDFAAKLAELVKKQRDANAAYRAAGGPRTPQPDPSQGSGGGRPVPTGAARGIAEAERRFGKPKTTTS